MKNTLQRLAKNMARHTLGYLPPPPARLRGCLAAEGGLPVRDVRLRPWPGRGDHRWRDWLTGVGPEFRRIFLSGVEGLPQQRQKQFAAHWAQYCGCRHGLLLPHGTDALRLALAAAFDHDGLDYGGEVIVPNLSFIASATAPLDRRFGIALVDVDSGTLNLDPSRVEEAIIAGKTRAILPVHQFGQPADMTALHAIAQRHGLKIIEDAAQAHGAVWESGPVGSLGDAAAFSFQSSKNLSCGEGGILTTNNDELIARAISLHNAGRAPDGGGRWEHVTLGWNCRPTEYQAALLSKRFGDFERQQAIRARNFAKLQMLLPEISCLQPLRTHPRVRRHGMYMFVLRYRAEACGGLPIERFLQAVGAEGAPLYRCYTTSLSNQPALQKLRARRPSYLRVLPTPVADQAVREIVYLPNSALLANESDMADIVLAVRKVERHFATQEAHPCR